MVSFRLGILDQWYGIVFHMIQETFLILIYLMFCKNKITILIVFHGNVVWDFLLVGDFNMSPNNWITLTQII